MTRKAEERIAEQVAQRVVHQLDAKPAISAIPPLKTKGTIPSLREKFGSFWGSAPIWGAVAVLSGAIVSQVSVRLLFIGVWAVVFIEFVRVDFFMRRAAKVLGNIVVGFILAFAFFQLWKVIPKPTNPPTLDQYVAALANKFPWLSNPPQVVPQRVTTPPPTNPTPVPKTTESSSLSDLSTERLHDRAKKLILPLTNAWTDYNTKDLDLDSQSRFPNTPVGGNKIKDQRKKLKTNLYVDNKKLLDEARPLRDELLRRDPSDTFGRQLQDDISLFADTSDFEKDH